MTVLLGIVLLLASAATAWCNPVTLTVGPQGVDYSAQTFSATCQSSYPTSSWVVISIDGKVCLDANVPAGSCKWTPKPGDIVQCIGKHWTSSNPHVVDGTVTQTVVAGTVPTPTPSTSPVPSPQPSNGPIVTGGCQNPTGSVWFVSAGEPLPDAKSGDAVLFHGGDIFNVEWDDPPSGICVSSFGTGHPVFDGQGVKRWAIGSVSGNNSPPKTKSITVDNLEIRHYAEMGLAFVNHDGGAPGQLQQVTVSNNLIYDNGPGCATTNGPCVGNDPGGYWNSLTIEDDRVPTERHAWQIVNNTVKWCGGHNCLQVHFDAGPTVVTGNTVGPGCVHGCLDVKGSGSVTGPATIANNTSECGLSQNLCGNNQQSAAYYTENPYNTAGSVMDYLNNIAQDSPVGFQACAGGCTTGSDCPMTLTYQGNQASGTPTWALFLGNRMCDGQSSSTAHATLTNNDWGGGKVQNGF